MRTRSVIDAALLVAGGVVMVVLIGFAAYALLADGGAEADAEEACKEAVLSDLKAPGSAEWVDVEVLGPEDSLSVRGEVDAQNGFGALLRHSFSCELSGSEVVEHTIYQQ